jgi:hypothetical protein
MVWRPLTIGLVTGFMFGTLATGRISDLEPLRHWRQAFGVIRGVVLRSLCSWAALARSPQVDS